VSDALWDFTGSSTLMSGILTFEQNIPRATRKIRLLIKKVGGVEERVFEWEFPPDKFSQHG